MDDFRITVDQAIKHRVIDYVTWFNVISGTDKKSKTKLKEAIEDGTLEQPELRISRR